MKRTKIKWNVYHDGEYINSTYAVSEAEACNNVRFNTRDEYRPNGGYDDGLWKAERIYSEEIKQMNEALAPIEETEGEEYEQMSIMNSFNIEFVSVDKEELKRKIKLANVQMRTLSMEMGYTLDWLRKFIDGNDDDMQATDYQRLMYLIDARIKDEYDDPYDIRSHFSTDIARMLMAETKLAPNDLSCKLQLSSNYISAAFEKGWLGGKFMNNLRRLAPEVYKIYKPIIIPINDLDALEATEIEPIEEVVEKQELCITPIEQEFKVPKGYILIREPKTERLNLLLRPSIKESITEYAQEVNESVNELINLAIEEYLVTKGVF